MGDRVTWLIPVLNGMPYLTETLASIEAQTYTNWEILVWDNGSTDGTIEELEKWIPSRLVGRVITGNPQSVGGSLAEMVKICNTEICARIDADDINLPNRLEKQLQFLSDHPEIAVLGSWMYFIDKKGRLKQDLYKVPLNHDDIVHDMLTGNAIPHPSVMFRRSAVLNVGNYSNLPQCQDFDLWLRILQQYQLANVEIPLVKYRIHEKSITNIAIRGNRLKQMMDDGICKYAPLTFGCSETEMRQLREQKHPFAIIPILKIAKYLQETQIDKSKNRLKDPSFINNVKDFVSSRDILSLLFLAIRHPDKFFLFRELKNRLKASAKKIPSLKLLRNLYRRYRDYFNHKRRDKQLNQWFKKLELNGSEIHQSVEFFGLDKPFNYIDIAEECKIERDFSLWLSPDDGADVKFVMKKRSHIGRNTYIGVFQPISIGECSLIGAYCYIISANHNYEDRDVPIRDQGYTGKSVVIEDDVWIGTHVVVLPGVTIGRGAIVAAHSLVNKNIPPYEIWGGVPAKFIKYRP